MQPLSFIILLNLLTFVSSSRPIKLPFTNYSLAINIERQLKSSTGIPLKDVKKSNNYTLLEDLIVAYTRSYNRIFPAIAHNLKRLSTFKLQSDNNIKKSDKSKTNTYWELAKSTPNNKLTCSVQLTVPDSTILARILDNDNPKLSRNSPYTSIQVLNTLRRTNPSGIEMIYYKTNLPFEHILSLASVPTLLLGVLIDYPLLIKLISYATFGSLAFIMKGLMWRGIIRVLTSRLFWHPTVYNIWCNIYYKTSGPAKLFTAKQVLDNIAYLCGEIYKLFLDATIYAEGVMLERDIKSHFQNKKDDIITIDCDKDRLFKQ